MAESCAAYLGLRETLARGWDNRLKAKREVDSREVEVEYSCIAKYKTNTALMAINPRRTEDFM
jgi:hypothetical protein